MDTFARVAHLLRCPWRRLPYPVIVALLSLIGLCATSLDGQTAAKSSAKEFLALVELVEDPKKQLELLDTFLVQFPNYEGMKEIYSQIQSLAVEVKLWDRAIEAGERTLAFDAGNLEAATLSLQAAEGKKDEALIAKWREAVKKLELAQAVVSAASVVRLPFVDEEPAGELSAVDLSSVPKEHRKRVEAALFNKAAGEKNPQQRLQLLALFQKEFPDSAHMSSVPYLFFGAYRDNGDHAKALAAAEALLAVEKTREDVLFYAAQVYFTKRQNPAKVVGYSTALVDLLATKPQPDHVTAAEWEKQKATMLLHAHWMIGSIKLQQDDWSGAEKALRSALPFSGAGTEMNAVVLNSLAWVNVKLGRSREALRLYEQCVSISSSVQAAAQQGLAFVRADLNLQK